MYLKSSLVAIDEIHNGDEEEEEKNIEEKGWDCLVQPAPSLQQVIP